MKLYEIDQRIAECIDMETGEVTDFEKLNALEIERTQKLENIALAYKNAKAEAAALKAEKEAFAEREKRAKSRMDWLSGYLKFVLDGEKFKTTKVEVSFRRSEAVCVECDALDLPQEYLTYKDPEPNKTAIKEALKAGVEINGCHIESRVNLTVK